MIQTFKLEKGEILFDEDKIIVKDDAKKQKWSSSLISGKGTLYFILTVWKSYKTGDLYYFWFGLIFILIGIPLLTFMLLRSVRSEISLNDIRSMKIKQRFGNKFLDIKLVNNRLRRVSELLNAEELEKYIATNWVC